MKGLLLLAVILVSTGCAHLNKEFDCPASKGVGCKRLSTINEEFNIKMGIPNVRSASDVLYTKSEQYDVYFEGYEDENGVYHHPKKITVKA